MNKQSTEKLRDYKPDTDLLAGRRILISGAGQGIGRCAAQCFAAHGAETILLGRNEQKLAQTAAEIAASGHPPPDVHLLDLGCAATEQYEQLSTSLAEKYDALHGLLHNAARLDTQQPLLHIDTDSWRSTLEINLNSALLLHQTLFPLLAAAEDASIVFTSSGLGVRGRAYWGAYCVSKFAVEGMAQVLAEELEHTSNVRVNVIDPGVVNTQMRRMAFPAENPNDNLQPEQIMGSYLYLMGPASKNIHGQRISA